MRYVLGIDSGGTNYRVMASDLQGTRLGYYVGQPANLHYLGEEELSRRIGENIDQCLAQFGGTREEAACLVCGTTGIDSEEDGKKNRKAYESLQGFSCPMNIINDAELAHYTVTGGKGILIISGTGSIAFGVNRQGKRERAGGWPLAILGDQGSGTWVTKMAMRHFGRYLDHAVEKGPLICLIEDAYGYYTRDDLIQAAMRGAQNPAGLPQLGSLVNQAAAQGDADAYDILEGAAKELFHIIEDIVYALKLEETEPDFSVGIWGSNLVKSEIVQHCFTQLIVSRYPQAKIVIPQREAIDGAISMALELVKDQ